MGKTMCPKREKPSKKAGWERKTQTSENRIKRQGYKKLQASCEAYREKLWIGQILLCGSYRQSVIYSKLRITQMRRILTGFSSTNIRINLSPALRQGCPIGYLPDGGRNPFPCGNRRSRSSSGSPASALQAACRKLHTECRIASGR